MSDRRPRVARTVLAQLIQERRMTLEEFTTYAEQFAREHGETGTLSYRHLQRLVAGPRPENQLPRPVRPATARLLERILGEPINVLLSAANNSLWESATNIELRQRLAASHRIDRTIVELLTEQLNVTRRIDREFGAVVAHAEVVAKAQQVTELFRYSTTPDVRAALAALLSELHTLAGWQALDLGRLDEASRHYELGKTSAAESGRLDYLAHATVEQTFVLLDIGDALYATNLLSCTLNKYGNKVNQLLHSWIIAAYGEALAVTGRQNASLVAFDQAAQILPVDNTVVDGPYVVLDSVHLARWRGHALARFGDAKESDALCASLKQLDPTFVRAETALRIDLAIALQGQGWYKEAKMQLGYAHNLAKEIGSVRHCKRIISLTDLF